MTIALYDDPAQYVGLGPDSADALARLGVSKVTFLVGSGAVAVVLEGWAFDVRDADEAAAAAVRGSVKPPRILYPSSDTAVHGTTGRGVPT